MVNLFNFNWLNAFIDIEDYIIKIAIIFETEKRKAD
jgi:hypothetical protein